MPTNVCLWLQAGIGRVTLQGPLTARRQTWLPRHPKCGPAGPRIAMAAAGSALGMGLFGTTGAIPKPIALGGDHAA